MAPASVTVVTAVGPYHLDLLPKVRATVAAQTVPCHHVITLDRDGRGAGWARNVGLARVASLLVVFLDADDTLEPDFIERCLMAYDGSHYVYTDWWQGDERKDAPDCPWMNRTWHCITTLLPAAWACEVGGFNEDLPGGEDTDFYLKLTTAGLCGKRLAEPLFRYGSSGRRAAAFVNGPQFAAVMSQFTERYGGKRMACGDCGNNLDVELPPSGDQQAEDVLAQAIWGGNRVERGRATGRLYPRTGNGKQLWVDPRDVDAAPHLFRRVREALPPALPVLSFGETPTVEIVDGDDILTSVEDVARAMVPGLQPAPPQPVEPVAAKPNVRRVRDLANASGEPFELKRRNPPLLDDNGLVILP